MGPFQITDMENPPDGTPMSVKRFSCEGDGICIGNEVYGLDKGDLGDLRTLIPQGIFSVIYKAGVLGREPCGARKESCIAKDYIPYFTRPATHPNAWDPNAKAYCKNP